MTINNGDEVIVICDFRGIHGSLTGKKGIVVSSDETPSYTCYYVIFPGGFKYMFLNTEIEACNPYTVEGVAEVGYN